MSIKRCPYCKALIDEGATHCANCGTRLIFSEDESIEEEIPGEKVLEEEDITKKKSSRRAKKTDEETGENIRELEVLEEEEPPADDEDLEIQLEEDDKVAYSENEPVGTRLEDSSSFSELRTEFEDLSDREEGEESERLSSDDITVPDSPENMDDFFGIEKESDGLHDRDAETGESREKKEDEGGGDVQGPESESDLEDDEYLLEDIEEEDLSELTPPPIEFSETGEEEDLIELQEESEFDDLDIDQINPEEEPAFDKPGDIVLEEDSPAVDEYEDDTEEVEEDLTSDEKENDYFGFEEIEEEPQGEDEFPSEGFEEAEEEDESHFQDQGESGLPFDPESSRALPEEPYKRTHTQDKIAAGEGLSDKHEGEEDSQDDEARPPAYRTGEQLNIFDPMEKEKEDIERFLESLKKDRRARVPSPETGELPPWAAEIKQEEQMAEEMLETEQGESIPSDDPLEGFEEEAPLEGFEEETAQPAPPAAEQKIHFEKDEHDLFEDTTQKSALLLWIKCRLVDLVFVSLLWISAIFGGSLVLGVSFLKIISSSTWIVVGFYFILLIQYFFLFSFFLGSTLGSRLFSQKD